MPDKWWGGSDPKLPPCLPGPSTPHGQGVLRAGGSGSEGASLARLARAPQFPGVTCESPPATSSALFLFTFPLPPTSRLTQRRDPSAEPCRAQPVPGILPHPRQAGGAGGTAPLPGRCPPFPLPAPLTATSRRRDAAAGPSLHAPCSQRRSHRTRARTPGTNPLRCCPGSSPRDSPLPRAAGSPGGFQGGPCPCPHTRTHTRRPPKRQAGA